MDIWSKSGVEKRDLRCRLRRHQYLPTSLRDTTERMKTGRRDSSKDGTLRHCRLTGQKEEEESAKDTEKE